MVGTGIKRVRKKRGLSQTDLADAVGMMQCNLSQIENNLKNGSAALFDKLAAELNTNVAVFYWYGLDREELDENVRIKFDILKPSIDQYFDEIFF